jgi:hypothetical protein
MQHNHTQHKSTITNKILYHCAAKCCYAVFMNVLIGKRQVTVSPEHTSRAWGTITHGTLTEREGSVR